MILVVDNYDSFTWNLVHYLGEIGVQTRVERNDSISVSHAMGSGASAILISPGPGKPDDAGISLELVAACAEAPSISAAAPRERIELRMSNS